MGLIIGNLAWIFASYLLGAVPFSFIVGWLKGVNLLDVGSKSSGSTNVYRLLGLKFAVVTFLLDMSKGYVSMWIAYHINGYDNGWVVLAGLAAMAGHTFTPFLRFKGGKGVATGVGLMLFIDPVIAIIGFLLEMIIIKATRYVSVASIIVAVAILIMSFVPFFGIIPLYRYLILIAVVYIIYKHIPNIQRLMNNQENKI